MRAIPKLKRCYQCGDVVYKPMGSFTVRRIEEALKRDDPRCYEIAGPNYVYIHDRCMPAFEEAQR